MFFVFGAASPPQKQKTFLSEDFSLREAIGSCNIVNSDYLELPTYLIIYMLPMW